MNERIKELLLKAGFTNAYTDPKEGFELVFVDEEHTTESVAKFAELIVKECISKCEFVADMATITNKGEMARKTKATADSCAKMIKEHFGVDE